MLVKPRTKSHELRVNESLHFRTELPPSERKHYEYLENGIKGS